MEVTRFNAPIVLEEFRRLVAECDFYAVDQEMTGIACPGAREDYGMDLGEAYAPKRNAATRYMAFQFGVALFTKKGLTAAAAGGKTEYDVRPFNFLLLKSDKDAEVVLSVDAVNFLIQNHMNFQSWLSSGLNYVTAAKEEVERKKLFPDDTWEEVITEDEKKWVEALEARIVDWYNSEASQTQPLELTEKHIHSNVDVALHYRLQTRGLWLAVVPAFDCGLPTWDRKKTTITKLASAAAAEELKANEYARRERLLSDRVGFRSFWNALVGSNKPHVGHNYSSDLMFMLHQHDAVLPASYREFKCNVHRLFPTIYDTKNLAAQLPVAAALPPFKNTALEPLFKESLARWGKDFEFSFPLGFEAYHPKMVASTSGTSGAVAHQGAFDAYMTGVVFVMIMAKLPEVDQLNMKNMVAVFGNHLSMNVSAQEQPDAAVARSAFHVAFSQRKMKRDDVKALLLTGPQEELLAAIATSRAGAAKVNSPAPPALDFHHTVLEKGDAYAAMNRDKSNAIVAIFSPGVTAAAVHQRLEDGLARLKANAAQPVGTSSDAATAPTTTSSAPNSSTTMDLDALTFVVTPFLQWKDDCKSSALLSEPVPKKHRTDSQLSE